MPVSTRLRILMVNKFYHLVGGTEQYLFSLTSALEADGHEVIPFAMQDERNVATPYRDWFSPYLAVRGELSVGKRVHAATQTLYSRQARRTIDRLIRHTQPHLAHLHNIYHHLSPSVLYALKAHGIPVVQTLHDYKLICANYRLFTHGAICERCKGNRHYNAILQRCCTGGLGASLVGAVEMYLHGALRSYARLVDHFICPSQFLRNKLAEFGFDHGTITHLPNFIDPSAFSPQFGPGQGYIAYVGRVTQEKGVATLIQAMAALPHLELRVVGTGDALPALQLECTRRGMRNVKLLGARPHEEAKALMAAAAVVVLPSEWHENCPFALLEAFALGKPVIGTRLGGIPELIDDGQDGLLVQPNDPTGLRAAITRLTAQPALLEQMGRRARAKVEQRYSRNSHLQAIKTIYAQVLGSRAATAHASR